MSLRGTIDKGLDLAWKEMGDLKTKMTIVKKSNSDFNFNSGEVTNNPDTNLTIDAVIFGSKKKNGIERKEVFFRHKDIGKMNQYSKIIIDSEEWDIGPSIINDDNYTKYLYVTRRGQ